MRRRIFLFTAASAAAVQGANERIRGAIIGAGGRGRFPTAEFNVIGADMAAVCDVYKPNLEAGKVRRRDRLESIARKRTQTRRRSGAVFQLVLLLGLLGRTDDRPRRAHRRFHPLVQNSGIPSAVVAGGGRPNLEGVEVPETPAMCLEYPENYPATFTAGYKAMRYSGTFDPLVQYNGSKARSDAGRERYTLYRENLKEIERKPTVQEAEPGTFDSATRAPLRNLLECMKSRQDPNAPVEAGHATSAAMCMAMESLRRGVRARWNEWQNKIDG